MFGIELVVFLSSTLFSAFAVNCKLTLRLVVREVIEGYNEASDGIHLCCKCAVGSQDWLEIVVAGVMCI